MRVANAGITGSKAGVQVVFEIPSLEGGACRSSRVRRAHPRCSSWHPETRRSSRVRRARPRCSSWHPETCSFRCIQYCCPLQGVQGFKHDGVHRPLTRSTGRAAVWRSISLNIGEFFVTSSRILCSVDA